MDQSVPRPPRPHHRDRHRILALPPRPPAQPEDSPPMKRHWDIETETNQTSSTDTNNQHGMGPVQGSGLKPLQAAAPNRLVHHAEILSLKGDTYRLRDKDLGRP